MDQGKKQKLIDAAVSLVAEVGLENFSMAKVAMKAGTSERLVYNHFKTKEAFLFTCFSEVNRELAAQFNGSTLHEWQNADSTVDFIRGLWMRFFNYLVKAGNRSIFFFEYRNSTHYGEVMENDAAAQNSYFSDFVQMYRALDELYHITDKVDEDCLWTYVLDATGVFSRRIIKGEMQDTEAVRESIWKLFSGGLLNLLM